jgi:tRNA G18 (ribose-2'-O)-methylase SpoU
MKKAVTKLSMESLEVRHQEASTLEPWPISVVCDNIRSALNVGSIFRTGDAFRIQHIWLCGISARPPHREILKTALGATETVSWSYHEDVVQLIQELQAKQYRCIGLEQTTGSVPLQNWKWDGQTPIALVAGNEVRGLSEELLSLLDDYIEIPQFGSKHSLNVSVATGIALWDLIRQQLA